MKRAYVTPTMIGERFVANEYVAACGDENKVYKFKCDAQEWTGLTGSTVWLNGPDGVPETSDDVKLGTYGRCGTEHEAKTTDEFYNGYLKKNIMGIPSGPRKDVIVWRGEAGDNIHCTTNLNINTWETAKS